MGRGRPPPRANWRHIIAGRTGRCCCARRVRFARLHTKTDLMKELDKMRRTAERLVPGAPHQTLLVMDATTGQNGLQQARLFTEAARVTGIVLTKLDGTAKGGIVLAIATELGLPVKFVGVGEKMEDILPFDSAAFVESMVR